MTQWKSWLARGIDLALGLLGLCMIYEGLIYFINTSGYVTGSEFGMLISIVNQLGLILMWLGLLGLRLLLSGRLKESATVP